ncbi:helix-turn-helix domain-containing protein [Halorubrum sp. F4]|uniref:ArsR/SmtB family transcription factor n=1 Tax=Halorubrum sp. F4 TaxID=2989715 RepID=UPI0024815186|nr:helix-turn-helix domain-containing protein [Halorubrum sp. F4]
MTLERLSPPPSESEIDRDRRTVPLDRSDGLLEVLACETAREVIAVVRESPSTPSEIADELDVSLQAVTYHLRRLQRVDLLAPVGVRYSKKGREMNLYDLSTESVTVDLTEPRM